MNSQSSPTSHRNKNGNNRTEESSYETGHFPDSISETTIMYQFDPPSAPCAALFTSTLQDSQHPTPTQVRAAVAEAIRKHGTQGCVGWMAQEFGDHPETAAPRMRWVKHAVAEAYPRPTGKKAIKHSFPAKVRVAGIVRDRMQRFRHPVPDRTC